MTSKTLTVYYLHSISGDYDLVALSDWSETQPSEYARLGKADAEFTCVSDADVLAAKVAGLESLETKIRADAQVRIGRVRDQINSMLAIAHEVEV